MIESAYFSEIAAHKGWHVAADKAMQHLIEQGEPFSADDVRELVAVEPDKPQAWGALLMHWRRNGHIARVGYTASRQAKNNRREQKLWVGVAQHKNAA